jgi:methyltransferase
VVSEILFTALLMLVALQRLLEVRYSRRNEAALRRRGAREFEPWQVPLMAAVHGAWLIGAVVEVWLLRPPVFPGLAIVAFVVFAGGQVLRLAAMRALGPRWTIRIMTLPGEPRVADGIYRFFRHPNYAGVVLEIAALPLVHGAIRTALLATIANAIVLFLRIRSEEHALAS